MIGLIYKQGYAEIQLDVYLNTKAYLIALQEDGLLNDDEKDINFHEYDFWVTADDSTNFLPIGVDTIEEGVLTIFGIEECKEIFRGINKN